MTLQKLLLDRSDVFYGLNDLRSDDLGRTWAGPTAHPSLDRRRPREGVEIVPCDFTPKWHAASRKLLGTGATFWYSREDNDHLPDGPSETPYAVYDPSRRSWGGWKTLALPDRREFSFARAGCTQRVDLPNGEILLPIYFRAAGVKPHTATVCRCHFDGETLTYLDHGDELSLDVERGFAEPSLTRWRDRFFLTLRNDLRGYVTTSRDGLHFEPPRPWTFDDGGDLGSYNTQQHWVTHGDGLYLVYTRRGANNGHVFRHRAHPVHGPNRSRTPGRDTLDRAGIDPSARGRAGELRDHRGQPAGNVGDRHGVDAASHRRPARERQQRVCRHANGTDGVVTLFRLLRMYRRARLASNRGYLTTFDRQGGPPVSDPTPAGSPAQFRSLLRSFVLDPGPLTDHVLAAEHLARVVAEEAGTTRDRIFTPLVTLATFLGQVLTDDHSCQAAVDRLIAWRARPRAARLLARHRRLLQGPPAAPRGAPAPAGPRHRRPARGARPRRLALPRPPRRPRRRLDGQHARHPGEPGRVPPARPPEARLRLPDRPDRRPDLPWPPAACSTRRSAPARGKLTGEMRPAPRACTAG